MTNDIHIGAQKLSQKFCFGIQGLGRERGKEGRGEGEKERRREKKGEDLGEGKRAGKGGLTRLGKPPK